MKKIIQSELAEYYCDLCGKKVEGGFFGGIYLEILKNKDHNEVHDWDLCRPCAGEVMHNYWLIEKELRELKEERDRLLCERDDLLGKVVAEKAENEKLKDVCNVYRSSKQQYMQQMEERLAQVRAEMDKMYEDHLETAYETCYSAMMKAREIYLVGNHCPIQEAEQLIADMKARKESKIEPPKLKLVSNTTYLSADDPIIAESVLKADKIKKVVDDLIPPDEPIIVAQSSLMKEVVAAAAVAAGNAVNESRDKQSEELNSIREMANNPTKEQNLRFPMQVRDTIPASKIVERALALVRAWEVNKQA